MDPPTSGSLSSPDSAVALRPSQGELPGGVRDEPLLPQVQVDGRVVPGLERAVPVEQVRLLEEVV